MVADVGETAPIFNMPPPCPRLLARGAEADICLGRFLGVDVVIKWRRPKPYRLPELDQAIRRRRTVNEATLMVLARRLGLSVPDLYMVNPDEAYLVMRFLEGPTAKQLMDAGETWPARELGRIAATLHRAGIIHGDLSPSNAILFEGRLHLIDFGLGQRGVSRVVDLAKDVNVVLRIMDTYGSRGEVLRREFWAGYAEVAGEELAAMVRRGVDRLRSSARYIPRRQA